MGRGFSGIVYKCILDEHPVAVKENADISSLKSLLSELKVLMYLGNHENIVKLVGAYTKDLSRGRAYMFVDFCPFGNLNDFLLNGRCQFINDQLRPFEISDSIRDGKQFTVKDLYNWAIQIASGMAYLSMKKTIHGDLATRNVLLTESRTAKITDFGMSNRLYDSAEYIKLQEEQLPWRWLALESMKEAVFSIQSDIWAYGVTLWEIFNLAETPYPNSCWGIPFITQVESGMRLDQPNYDTGNLYEKVMLQCWQKDPQLRPSFESICLTLQEACSTVRVSCGYEKVLPQHCQSQGKIQTGDLSTPNCTLGLHQKPQTFVEITCPEVDVFIVKGDYTIFYIACSSSFPLDFSFNGIRPTEAIDVSFKRQEKDGSDREKFLYQVDVQVQSNTALLKYYYPDSSISESRKPGAAVYSRTGSYSFSGFHDRSNISTNFYIFFEEPLVEPNFITNRNIVLEIEDDIIRIPCRPTTFNASVNLLQNGQLVQNSLYSPQNGFSILHEASFLNLSTKFSCHLVNDNRTVTIDIPMTR
ncbi:unnamed protein product [Allacma fusca]|uniref:Protein kinase domain-containing protein n=2 Tax=Allacma fusca TaxID=39272 RepID=A0A8J2JLZ6_9HEXA|nr:unnamed protein product [Allacma fusca]